MHGADLNATAVSLPNCSYLSGAHLGDDELNLPISTGTRLGNSRVLRDVVLISMEKIIADLYPSAAVARSSLLNCALGRTPSRAVRR